LRKERRLRVLRYETTGDWRRLHNEELNDLYSSLSIFPVIKSRRMRWAGHVAYMEERCIQNFGGEVRRKENTWKT